MTAPPFDVDLLVSPVDAGSRLTVTGQVLGGDEDALEPLAPLAIELARAGQPAVSTSSNEFGEFTIEDVPAGVYDIRILGPDRDIMIEGAPIALE